jgi:fatty acid desaturase
MNLPSARARLDLSNRHSFMKVASVGFGGLYGALLLWMFGSLGGLVWWLFIVALACVAGYVWAFLMWFVFKAVYDIDEPKDAKPPDSRKP